MILDEVLASRPRNQADRPAPAATGGAAHARAAPAIAPADPAPPPASDPRAAALVEMVARVREGYRVALHSGTLGEQFLLVRDEAARRDVPVGEARAVYTLAEVEALAGAPPDLVQAMHALKAPLAGRVVAVELGA